MDNANAHEILPGLWLGNKGASQDYSWLHANQVRAVFNCTKDIPFRDTSLRLYRVPLDDNLREDEIRNLELWSWETIYKLHNELKQGHVLVHCFAGMQRSAAVVALYLVAMYRCTTDEAIAFIKSRRRVAFMVNTNFYKSIKGFERGFREMITKTDALKKYPRIPLPTDFLTNT